MPLRRIKDRSEQAKQQLQALNKPAPGILGAGKGSKKADEPKSLSERRDEKKAQQREQRIMLKEYGMKKGGLSAGQKKIASKAPPYNEIGGNDFAVLRKEKAKGRGMGLQDEKVKPGKVMKARMGVATDYKKYLKGLKKATDSVKKDKENKFIKRRMKLMGMSKLSKGGGADTGTVGEIRSKIGVMFNKATRQGERIMGPKGRKERLKKIKGMAESAMNRKNIQSNLASAKDFQKGRRELFKSTAGKKIPAIMGGGMIGASQMPKYSKGTMIMARGCKLGRKKATKIT